MSPNVLVAPNRNKLIHYVLLAGTGCTNLVELYTWFLQVVSAAQCVSCSKQELIITLCTFGWFSLHTSCGIILIDGVYS